MAADSILSIRPGLHIAYRQKPYKHPVPKGNLAGAAALLADVGVPADVIAKSRYQLDIPTPVSPDLADKIVDSISGFRMLVENPDGKRSILLSFDLAVEKISASIRNEPVEHSFVLTRDGLIWFGTGTETFVYIPDDDFEEIRRHRGEYLVSIHNHPGFLDGGHSLDDFVLGAKSGCAIDWIVVPYGRYLVEYLPGAEKRLDSAAGSEPDEQFFPTIKLSVTGYCPIPPM